MIDGYLLHEANTNRNFQSSMLMGAHVQHKVVLVLRFFVTNWTLELWLDAAFEADVPVETVWPSVRIAAPRTGVGTTDNRRRHCHRLWWRRRHAHALEHRHRQGGSRTCTARVRRSGQLYRRRRSSRERFGFHSARKLPQVSGRC
uniref:Uncharacterized protein n=1 Tax=Anopheles dirus TaxID=7168 RepID=A0A182NX04_9DIPT